LLSIPPKAGLNYPLPLEDFVDFGDDSTYEEMEKPRRILSWIFLN